MPCLIKYLDTNASPIKCDGVRTRALLGDSLSLGVAANATGIGLGTLLADALGWTCNNMAKGGQTVADQSSSAFMFEPVQGDIYTLWLGTNDKILGANDANREAVTKAGHLALLLHLATKEGSNKVHGQSMSTTETWVNLGASTDPKGRGTITNGSTISATVTGTSVALVGFWQVTNGATFTVTIDGVGKGTFSAQPNGNVIVTNTGAGTGPFALVFSGLTNAAHTVVVSCSVPGGGVVYIGFIAGYGSTLDTTNPLVVVANTHDFTAAGNTAQGTTTTQNGRYKTMIADNVQTAQDLGLNVEIVDADALLSDADLGSDGLHCNSGGYIKMRDAFVAAIRG